MAEILLVARNETTFVNFRLPWLKYMVNCGHKFIIFFEALSDELMTILDDLGVEYFIFSERSIDRYSIAREVKFFYWVRSRLRRIDTKEYVLVVYFFRSCFWASIFLAGIKYKKIVYLIEGLGSIGVLLNSKPGLMALNAIIFLLKSKSDKVICLNNRDEKIFRDSMGSAKVYLMPGIGFDNVKYTGVTRNKVKKVVFAGRLLKSKGIHEFINIIRNNCDQTLEFFIAGRLSDLPKNLQPVLYDLIHNKKVTFLGYRNDMHDVLAQADLLVFPSHYNEGLPRIVLEAMGSGCIIYATNFVGSDLIRSYAEYDDEFLSQFVVQDKYVENFADFITDLNNSDLVIKLSLKNIRIAQLFSSSKIDRIFEEIIVS